jgi:hypothetical protein
MHSKINIFHTVYSLIDCTIHSVTDVICYFLSDSYIHTRIVKYPQLKMHELNEINLASISCCWSRL